MKLISGPTIGPEGSLENEARNILKIARTDFTIVPELVRPVHPLKDFIALRKLEKILREQKPDLVHTHSGKAGILGRLAAKRAGVPVIIHHIHGPSFGNFQGALANFVFTAAEKYAARVTDHFFCSADAMTKLYLAAGIGKPEMFTRIFSGFNLEPFLNATNDLALRQQLGLDAKSFCHRQNRPHFQAQRPRRFARRVRQNSSAGSTRAAAVRRRRRVARRN